MVQTITAPRIGVLPFWGLLAFFVWTSQAFGQSLDFERNDKTTYVLNTANDISLTFTALLTSGIGTFLYYQMQVPPESKIPAKDDLLPWDRKFAGRYSETADLMSDIGTVLAVTPLAIGGIALKTGRSTTEEFGIFSLMLVQSILFQNGINLAFRSMELWPRPYIYAEGGEGKKKAEKAKAEAYGSFFSGHTSAAFTIAVFTTEWYSETFRNPVNTRVVRALAFSLAGVEGALRIAAGKHYPSDVIVGALVGTGVSYGILEMHKKENQKYCLWVVPGAAGTTIWF